METHKPKMITDGGPWVKHDMPCPVMWMTGDKAVYNLNTHVFEPSWRAQKEGWMTIRPPRLLRKFLRRYAG